MKTEAEQEREARARIDRLNDLRRKHAERKGQHPADIKLTPEDFEEAEKEPAVTSNSQSKTQRILDACKDLADLGGVVDRDRFLARVGALDPGERDKVIALVSNMKTRGIFPYTLSGGRSGPKPATTPKPNPTPKTDRQPSTPIADATFVEESKHNTSELAETLAQVDRMFDEMAESDRTIVMSFLRRRFNDPPIPSR